MRSLRSLLLVAALLLALGAGSAGAAALITGRQIQDETVTGVDVRGGGLTGRDVRDGSLAPADFRGAPPGPQGAQGPQGAPGAEGIEGTTYRTVDVEVLAGSRLSWNVRCAAGETALAGGVATTRPDKVAVIRSFPDGFYWHVGIENTHTAPVIARGWAVCFRLP